MPVELAAGERYRLALAEDDDVARSALEEGFRDEGFEVASFEDGYELFDYLATEHTRWPDLIVSDLVMPGRGGIDALRAARAHGCRAPILVITGRPAEDVACQVAQLGNALLFTKPLDLEQLTRVARALAAPPCAGCSSPPNRS